MQVADRNAGPDTPALSDDLRLPLVDALQSLYRAVRKRSIYPAEHPSVPESVRTATGKLRTLLAGRPPVVVGVSRDCMLGGGEPLGADVDRLRALARMLHSCDVAAIEFHPDPEPSSVLALVEELVAVRREGSSGPGLVPRLAERGVRNPKVCPIDYRALSFAEGVQSADDAAGSDPWRQLTRLLTDPATFEAGAPVEEIAEDVAEMISAYEGTGIASLRSELSRKIDEIRRSSGQQAIRRRMAHFVNALNPELRRNLLQVGPGQTRESLRLMSEFADSLPSTDLVSALQNVDASAGQASHELVLLLGKLNSIARSKPRVEKDLRDTLKRWGISPVLLDDEVGLREALQEVFQKRTDEIYNPTEYQEMLGRLSREAIEEGVVAERSRVKYRDPSDPDDVRDHAAEVAVELLRREDGDGYRGILYGFVATQADALIEHGCFTSLAETGTFALRDRTRTAEEETRLAAQSFLGELAEPDRIRRTLAVALAKPAFPEAALRLLDFGGTAALDRTLDRLADDDLDPFAAKALRSYVLGLDPDTWEQTIPARAARGWEGLAPVFPVWRMMESERAVPELRKLLGHAEARVRKEALTTLCEIDVKTSPERYLGQALGDDSAQVVGCAIRRLAERGRASSLELLGSYLADELSFAAPTPEACDIAVEALVGRGSAERALLAQTLTRLAQTFHPRHAGAGRIIAEGLGGIASPSDEVRAALDRWQRCPARYISLLLRRKKSGGDSPC